VPSAVFIRVSGLFLVSVTVGRAVRERAAGDRDLGALLRQRDELEERIRRRERAADLNGSGAPFTEITAAVGAAVGVAGPLAGENVRVAPLDPRRASSRRRSRRAGWPAGAGVTPAAPVAAVQLQLLDERILRAEQPEREQLARLWAREPRPGR
jgi:hypothetical protein